MPDFSPVAFALIALVTLGAGALAFSLKNIIRCAILLVVSWVGIAAFYLWAGAEFAAFAQILVYVGAVSMVVLFAVLLTRKRDEDFFKTATAGTGFKELGKLTGAIVAAVLVFAVATTPLAPPVAGNAETSPAFSVKQIGESLMQNPTYVGGLMIVGVLLTVALIGATVIAAGNKEDEK